MRISVQRDGEVSLLANIQKPFVHGLELLDQADLFVPNVYHSVIMWFFDFSRGSNTLNKKMS